LCCSKRDSRRKGNLNSQIMKFLQSNVFSAFFSPNALLQTSFINTKTSCYFIRARVKVMYLLNVVVEVIIRLLRICVCVCVCVCVRGGGDMKF
jgi:hypothetical protein